MTTNSYYPYPPPYPTGNWQPYSPQQDYYRLSSERNTVKKLSRCAGLCVIAYVAIQYAFVLLLSTSGLNALYFGNLFVRNTVDVAFYVCSIFVPFFVLYLTMSREERAQAMSFDAPVSKSMLAPAVLVGFLMCIVGNFATNYLVYFLENVGFELTGGEYEIDPSPQGLVYSLLTVAIIPGLVEEFALRGVVMQPLRKYGDGFAVMMSSLVFALMHGNLIQIPFAFIVGIALGYLVISTGSIWTGVIIHILNNAYSVVLNFLLDTRPTLAEDFYSVSNAVAIVLGVIALCVYVALGKRNRMKKGECALSVGQRTAAYIFTLPMIVAILILVFETAGYVKYVGT